jgi:hypothetical protein
MLATDPVAGLCLQQEQAASLTEQSFAVSGHDDLEVVDDGPHLKVPFKLV